MNEQDAIRSKEMNELIRQQPGMLVRFGNLMLLAVFVLAASLAYFIRYPDVISTTGKIVCIDSANCNQLYAELEVKPAQFNKVQAGQKVLLRYAPTIGHDIPATGGETVATSKTANNDVQTIRVEIKENSTHLFKKDDVVQADIITKKLSLWDRLLQKIKRQSIP